MQGDSVVFADQRGRDRDRDRYSIVVVYSMSIYSFHILFCPSFSPSRKGENVAQNNESI